MDKLAVAIEVGHFQGGRFRYATPGSVQGRQNRPVAEVLRRFEQSFDLFLCQDDGQLLFIAGQRDAVDLDPAIQGIAVEKPEPADGLNVGGELWTWMSWL